MVNNTGKPYYLSQNSATGLLALGTSINYYTSWFITVSSTSSWLISNDYYAENNY